MCSTKANKVEKEAKVKIASRKETLYLVWKRTSLPTTDEDVDQCFLKLKIEHCAAVLDSVTDTAPSAASQSPLDDSAPRFLHLGRKYDKSPKLVAKLARCQQLVQYVSHDDD